MIIIINELDSLFAEFTCSWLLSALLRMVPILILFSSKSTIFTGYTNMFFFIVLLFFAFGNASATLLAFVILSRASNIMHSKFANLDVFFTQTTPFRFYWFFH
jgi:hypothetical protein